MTFLKQIHQDKNCRARCGIMHTDHGDIETPVFMPVGTQATVKTLDSEDLKKMDAQIILGNNYHLHLRPGEDLIAATGGLHKFMNWERPILTDSGGFQVFSLGAQKKKKNVILTRQGAGKNLRLRRADPSSTPQDDSSAQDEHKDNSQQGQLVTIDEDGVTFKSHIDGSTHRFTPESAIECEHKIGADIIMAFDECTPDDAPEKYVREAMERTHRWAERSLKQHVILTRQGAGKNLRLHRADPSSTPQDDKLYQQFLFGIIQGANYRALREESAKHISSLDFDGIAIGGESVGYNMKATEQILDWVYPFLPTDKPHYTMGVGLDPADLLTVIEHGADMFDCVAPTRLARHGMLFVSPEESAKHRINIRNANFATDTHPIDADCRCHTCQNYSRSYLHHLFDAQEMTAMRLASIHNLHFMLDLMRQAREAIEQDKFLELRKKWK